MATRPRPVKHVLGLASNGHAIWGDPAKVKTFFPDLTPATDVDPVDRTMNVKGHVRRQYPGDATPINRGPSSRTVLIGGATTARTTPGRAFWCEVTTGTGPTAVTKATQFTVVGPFSRVLEEALLAAGTGAGAAKWVLRSPGGKGYKIERSAAVSQAAMQAATP